MRRGIRDYLGARRGRARRHRRRDARAIAGAARRRRPPAAFLDVVKADAARARAALRFVLAQPSIGSQIVDNLNATTTCARC